MYLLSTHVLRFKSYTHIISFNPHNNSMKWAHYYLNFTNKETEALTSSRSQNSMRTQEV